MSRDLQHEERVWAKAWQCVSGWHVQGPPSGVEGTQKMPPGGYVSANHHSCTREQCDQMHVLQK